MDLAKNFEEVTWDKTVCVNELERNRTYPISRAKRITTRIGPAVVLIITASQEDSALVFLPKRYGVVTTDDDIEKINTNAASLNLV